MIVAKTDAMYENIFGRARIKPNVRSYLGWYSRRYTGGNGAGVLRNERHQTYCYMLDWNHEVFKWLDKQSR